MAVRGHFPCSQLLPRLLAMSIGRCQKPTLFFQGDYSQHLGKVQEKYFVVRCQSRKMIPGGQGGTRLEVVWKMFILLRWQMSST